MINKVDLNFYLPENIREWIENRYYAQVTEKSQLDIVKQDPVFWDSPNHPAWISDHGIVHVRDVARQTLHVLDLGHGVLFPIRSRPRMDFFMKGYGVLLAYLHDIGMFDLTPIGRAMHPEYVCQAVFSPEFDEIVDQIWAQNCGNLAWRLLDLSTRGLLNGRPQRVLRELMSLAICHSKSKVPIELLGEPGQLRQLMIQATACDLIELHEHQKSGAAAPQPSPLRLAILSNYYGNFEEEAFDWFLMEGPEIDLFKQDIFDTVRTVRCADALRLRGTVQKTSGGYQMFINRKSGQPIYALREGDERIFLLERQNLMVSGEANISGTELTGEGHLRISFHRGDFATPAAQTQAAAGAAVAVLDIQMDIVAAFDRLPNDGPFKAPEIETQLETTDDNPAFILEVIRELTKRSPEAAARVRIVPTLHSASELEAQRYLRAKQVVLSPPEVAQLLENMEKAGSKTSDIDPKKAFKHVRCEILRANEVLIEENTVSSLVYIPLNLGLEILPLGGYETISAPPYVPLGNTGVIRGAVRNARVIARQNVTVLIIPKEVYLEEWFWPYSIEEWRALIFGPAPGG